MCFCRRPNRQTELGQVNKATQICFWKTLNCSINRNASMCVCLIYGKGSKCVCVCSLHWGTRQNCYRIMTSAFVLHREFHIALLFIGHIRQRAFTGRNDLNIREISRFISTNIDFCFRFHSKYHTFTVREFIAVVIYSIFFFGELQIHSLQSAAAVSI